MQADNEHCPRLHVRLYAVVMLKDGCLLFSVTIPPRTKHAAGIARDGRGLLALGNQTLTRNQPHYAGATASYHENGL